MAEDTGTVPAAGSRDGGALCAPRSCWEPRDSHTRTAGSHHGLTCGAVFRAKSRSGPIQQPGRAQWVTPTAFGEVCLKNLKFCCKNKLLLQRWAALRSCVPAEIAPGPAALGRDEQELGHLCTHSRTTLPLRAADGHLEGSRSHRLLLPDPVCVSSPHPGEQRCQVTSAGSAGLSQGASKANAKCHRNYKASASATASPALELLHQPCTRPTWRGRARKSDRIRALVSAEPRIPQALLSPASAGLDGKGEGPCKAAISISGPSLPHFVWAQGVF